MTKQISIRRGAGLGAMLAALVLASCGGDTTSSAAPTITGCGTVFYRGESWEVGDCRGVASFHVTIQQNGSNACFDVVCSSGCVASATPC